MLINSSNKYILPLLHTIGVLVLVFSAYTLGRQSSTPEDNKKVVVINQKSNIPKQYFDFNVLSSEDTTSYVEMGQVPNQDVSDIGYTTIPKQFVQDKNDDSTVIEVDIDNDGVNEQANLKSVAMTHSPHQLQIVKDNIIIFESSPMGDISFLTSPSHNGFYLYGTPQNKLGTGYKVIRFAWVDGKIAPVWQQWVSYWQYRE